MYSDELSLYDVQKLNGYFNYMYQITMVRYDENINLITVLDTDKFGKHCVFLFWI